MEKLDFSKKMHFFHLFNSLKRVFFGYQMGFMQNQHKVNLELPSLRGSIETLHRVCPSGVRDSRESDQRILVFSLHII